MENKWNNKNGYLLIKQESGLAAEVTNFEEGTMVIAVYISGSKWMKDDRTTAKQIATEFKMLHPVFKDAIRYNTRIKYKTEVPAEDTIQFDRSDSTQNSSNKDEAYKPPGEAVVHITGCFEDGRNILDKFKQFSDQQRLSMFMQMINNEQVSEYDDLLNRWWVNRY